MKIAKCMGGIVVVPNSPESLGIVSATVYILSLILLEILCATTDEKVFVVVLCDKQMAEYNAAILSISLMTLLGFVDDVLELRWRYKLIIPFIATLPLVQTYWSQNQSTTIALPSQSLYTISISSFLGCILGTSKENLSWLGKIVSLFAEVSGQPYGTAIDLRRKYRMIHYQIGSITCTSFCSVSSARTVSISMRGSMVWKQAK